ncbi:acyltransferase family protein [Pseudonocardia sp. ICBG1142]|uniref:acyltransferase family protein n=1 Tax=Pseudonocardia sp. ICBG1142 TaxID=2846760 RepID=UPI001CF62409|nr:acyltransferase family protein [Pseudonocardia sp. ICBG1142]
MSGARALQIVGALLLVVAALCRPPVLRVLERPWVQWLGSRSFSLYLIHDAVVISTVLLFGGRPPVWLTVLVAVPVALVVAEVFFRVAERPAHRLARRIGRRVEGAAQVRPVA